MGQRGAGLHGVMCRLVLVATLVLPVMSVGIGSREVIADPEETGVELGLPPVPDPPPGTIVVDRAGIEQAACLYCAEAEDADPVDFTFADLARRSVDAACSAPGADVARLLGNMYVSGYLGGVWFRDQVTAFDAGGGGGGAILRATAQRAARMARVGAVGSDTTVVSQSRGNLLWLLLLYGYNRAYLEVTLANPPPGVTVPETAVVFHRPLDTEVASFPLAVNDTYSFVPDELEHPSNPRWTVLAWLTHTFLAFGEAGGGAVWRAILALGDFTPETYAAVVDLSAGFLVVAEAALRASLAAAAGDPGAGRCSLKLAAALLVWSGSYLAGLASDLPAGTVPELTCPQMG